MASFKKVVYPRKPKVPGPTPDFPLKSTFVGTTPLELFDNLLTKATPYSIETFKSIIFTEDIYDKVNIITDLFTEYARIEANVINNLSPLEYWKLHFRKIQTDAEKLKKTEFHKKVGYNITDENAFYSREAIYSGSKEATCFSPSLTKVLYDMLLGKIASEKKITDDKWATVLDPFSG